MNEIVINNQNVLVKEYEGKRVVTFKDIDMVHGGRRERQESVSMIIRSTLLRAKIITEFNRPKFGQLE